MTVEYPGKGKGNLITFGLGNVKDAANSKPAQPVSFFLFLFRIISFGKKRPQPQPAPADSVTPQAATPPDDNLLIISPRKPEENTPAPQQ